jgi:dynein heavy chain
MEASKFREVDSNWRTMMTKINANTKVIVFTKNKKLLEVLKDSHDSLDIVQKGLFAYLEGKRSNFPRFYFLSNDELLEILRETKDP